MDPVRNMSANPENNSSKSKKMKSINKKEKLVEEMEDPNRGQQAMLYINGRLERSPSKKELLLISRVAAYHLHILLDRESMKNKLKLYYWIDDNLSTLIPFFETKMTVFTKHNEEIKGFRNFG